MISVAIEGITTSIVELAPLLRRQWDELGAFCDRMPLVPDFGMYIVRENQGACFMAAARDAGNLVGYYICLVQPMPHHMTTLSGYMDFMWVSPECRKKGTGQLLLNAAQTELRRRGAKVWFSASRMSGSSHESMDKLLRRNGFNPLDLIYAKWIDT